MNIIKVNRKKMYISLNEPIIFQGLINVLAATNTTFIIKPNWNVIIDFKNGMVSKRVYDYIEKYIKEK